MSLKNLGAVGPIYAHLGLLYLHLPTNSILPGSALWPTFRAHRPRLHTPSLSWGCVESPQKSRKSFYKLAIRAPGGYF